MSRRLLAIASVVLLALVWLAPLSRAQIISSSIVGMVTDTSGASVPEAQITVTNEGTGISFTTTADSAGAYSVPNLQAGTYTLSAAKAGFQTFRTKGVELLASQSVRVSVQLKVGEMQQSVTVSGEATLVKTESPTIGGTVTGKQMSELPLSQKSIDGLLALVPGAQTNGAWPQTGGATHWGSTVFTINGTQANDFGNGSAAYSYNMGLISLPPVQSLQEFKVEAYNTNAEYRNVSTVTMVTKAGTNAFHGDLYEYNQNKSLNANSFLNNANGRPRAPFVRNQFGANLGGPIRRNKAFFFASYAGLRNRQYATPQLTYPSMEMRQGDFSALCSVYGANGACADPRGTQLYNPWTGNPFPGNRIPTSMITSQAQTLMKYVPAPNTGINAAGLPSGGNNYYGMVSTAQVMNAVDLRLDYQISERDQLYGVYTRNIGNPWEVSLGYPSTYGNASDYGYKTIGYSLVETHTFNPHTLNDFRFAWFDHPNIRSGVNQDFDPRKLFPQLTASPNRGLPAMTMTGYTGITDVGTGYYNHNVSMEWGDNVTHVRGRHTLKFGANATTYKSYAPSLNAPRGSFSFNGQWTGNKGWPGYAQSQGNSWADFMLGAANSAATGYAAIFENVYWGWDWEFYAQDTWQASPRLTVYYGMRYVYQTPWNWQGDYSTYWDPATNKLALPQDSDTPTLPPLGASAAMFNAYPFTTTHSLGIDKRYMIGDKNNWGPRIGLAYRPFRDNRTVVRAGYGVYYNFNPTYIGGRNDVNNPPWAGGASTSNYLTQLSGNIKTPFTPDVTFSDPFPARLQSVSGASKNPTLYALQRDFKTAAIQQWNLTFEHQFSANWAGRATYAGSQTHHIAWFYSDLNIPATQTPNVSFQNQRPYQPWATINSTRSGGSQNFNQLQLEATKRFSRGFTLQLEYAWTRSLDNVDTQGGPQNPNFPGLDYGNTAGVRRHTLVFNYLYELPFGRGKHFLPGAGRLAEAVLGGWQVSGISSYMTGSPFSVNFQVPSSYTGWWGGRADRVAGSDAYANRGGGHDVISGIQWFDPAAFAVPQPWTWGNGARNSLFGPGSWNWDISLAKNCPAGDRVRVQLRAELLNAFNHFSLSSPNTLLPDLRDGGTPNPNIGRITSGSGSRVVQVGAKLTF